MSNLFEVLEKKISGKNLKIVFPEGLDDRVLAAAGRLAQNQLVTPIIIGNAQEVQAKASQLNVSLDAIEIYDPKTYDKMDEMVATFVEIRKGKATEEQARTNSIR